MLQLDQLSVQILGKQILQDISLELEPGQIHGILGPNGAGKSTLLKAIAGLLSPSSGTLTWNGQDLSQLSRRHYSRLCSLVPQAPQICFDYTAEEVVKMGLYAQDPHHCSSSQVTNALKLVDTYHLRHRSINHISVGERQRVYIARSLVTQAPILLLDEPTSNLDIRHRLEIWSLLQELTHPDRLIIVALHDLHMAAERCDRVTILDEGKCVAHGPCKVALTQQRLIETFGVQSVEESVCSHFTLA